MSAGDERGERFQHAVPDQRLPESRYRLSRLGPKHLVIEDPLQGVGESIRILGGDDES